MSVQAISEKQDELRMNLSKVEDQVLATLEAAPGDERWKAIARTHIQQGFMAAKRALYEGKRVGDP